MPEMPVSTMASMYKRHILINIEPGASNNHAMSPRNLKFLPDMAKENVNQAHQATRHPFKFKLPHVTDRQKWLTMGSQIQDQPAYPTYLNQKFTLHGP